MVSNTDAGASETLADERTAAAPQAAAHTRASPDAARQEPLPRTIGRFSVLEQLGRGGMGVVYAAYDPELDRKVAIKVVRGERDAHASRRLLREAQAMARLTHEGVVSVFDVGVHGGAIYIAMEYLDGGTLREFVRTTPPPSWREILERYLRAGEGLNAAHRAGLVHRDFKPDNVLLGRDGRVRVADFGLVRGFSPLAETTDEARAVDEARGRVEASEGARGTPTDEGGARSDNPRGRDDERTRGEDSRMPGDDHAARSDDTGMGSEDTGARGDAIRTHSEELLSPTIASAKGARSGAGDLRADASLEQTVPLASFAEARGLRPSGILALGPSVSVTHGTVGDALMGTPAYMAPEQFAQGAADARSDQFAFCVALWEALTGARPFAGDSVLQIAAAVSSGELSPWPRHVRVPGRLRRALVRGLSLEPEHRYPSMAVLVAELRAVLGIARSRGGLIGFAVIGGVAITLGLLAQPTAGPRGPDCRAGRAQIGAIWDEARAQTLRERFVATRLPFARDQAEGVITALSAYAATWAQAHRDACEATHIRGEQSEAFLDQRMTCLALHKEQLASAVAALDGVSAETVANAPEVLGALGDVTNCADPATTQIEGETPTLDEEGQAIRTAISRGTALVRVGDHTAAHALLEDALARARRHGARTLLVDALIERAYLETAVGGARDATRAYLHEALPLALELRRRSFAGAAIDMARLLQTSGDHAGARLWAELGIATIEPARRDRDELYAGLLLARANVEGSLGHRDRSCTDTDEALAVLGRAYGSLRHPNAAKVLASAATIYINAAHYEQAEEVLSESIEVISRAYGADHPIVIASLMSLGDLRTAQGRPTEALGEYQRAEAVSLRAYGPDSHRTQEVRSRIGIALDEAGRPDEARPFLVQAYEGLSTLGVDFRVSTIEIANSLCFVDYNLGDYDSAQRWCEAAMAQAQAQYPGGHPLLGIIENNRGLIARAQGDAKAGLERDRSALTYYEASIGPDHHFAAYATLGIGESLLMLGRRAEALEAFERTLAIREATSQAPALIAEAKWGIARALPERERARALALATAAVTVWSQAEGNYARPLASAKAWLAEHAAAPP